jgi:hypothetical protein
VAGTGNRWRRRAVAVALASALTALAGCGGGGGTTIINKTTGDTNATNSQGFSTTMVARGPSDLAANLDGQLAKSFRQLRNIDVVCPAEPTPPHYPVNCTVTAIDTSKPGSRDAPDGAHRPVSGTITVLGVYPRTKTYAFGYSFSAQK